MGDVDACPDCAEPAHSRSTAPVERNLQAFGPSVRQCTDTPEVTWLRAAALSARKDYVAAKTLLETACAAHPRELALWTARADLAIRQQHWSEAAGLLDQGEKTIGDSAELRFARSRVWGTEGTAEARRRLITLTDNLDRFGVVERTRRFARASSDVGATGR